MKKIKPKKTGRKKSAFSFRRYSTNIACKVLPPLMWKANKMQKRCYRLWSVLIETNLPRVLFLLDKVHEEIEEILAEINKPWTEPQSRIEEEISDLLFVVVNLSCYPGHGFGLALQKACRKFEHRLFQVEKLILNKGGLLENATLEEIEKLWQ